MLGAREKLPFIYQEDDFSLENMIIRSHTIVIQQKPC